MRVFSLLLFITLYSCQPGSKQVQYNQERIAERSGFKLTYTVAGLGSNMGKKGPYLEIKGLNYCYLYKQNSSWDGTFTEKADTVCTGKLSVTAVDSILLIAKSQIGGPEISAFGTAMSGSLYSLYITQYDFNLHYSLMNTSNVNAQRILDIISREMCADHNNDLQLFPNG